MGYWVTDLWITSIMKHCCVLLGDTAILLGLRLELFSSAKLSKKLKRKSLNLTSCLLYKINITLQWCWYIFIIVCIDFCTELHSRTLRLRELHLPQHYQHQHYRSRFTQCNKIWIILGQKNLAAKFQCFPSYFCYWRFNHGSLYGWAWKIPSRFPI